MSKKGPYLPWYPGDIKRDTALNSVSLGAYGLWHKLLYLMFDAQPYGHCSVNNKVIPEVNLSRMVGCEWSEFKPLLTELEEAQVFSRLPDGTIYSRRMIRDAQRSANARANGSRGGNPNLLKGNSPSRSLNLIDKGSDNQFLALCLLPYDNEGEEGKEGTGEKTRSQIVPPFRGEEFADSWDAWIAMLRDEGRLYKSVEAAQDAIDLLKPYDEAYATQMLKLAAVGRWKSFVFDDSMSKYRASKKRGGGTTESAAQPRGQNTVQKRDQRPPSLEQALKDKGR